MRRLCMARCMGGEWPQAGVQMLGKLLGATGQSRGRWKIEAEKKQESRYLSCPGIASVAATVSQCFSLSLGFATLTDGITFFAFEVLGFEDGRKCYVLCSRSFFKRRPCVLHSFSFFENKRKSCVLCSCFFQQRCFTLIIRRLFVVDLI